MKGLGLLLQRVWMDGSQVWGGPTESPSLDVMLFRNVLTVCRIIAFDSVIDTEIMPADTVRYVVASQSR